MSDLKVLKNRLTSNKSLFTKALNTCKANLENFRQAEVKESSEHTRKRVAGLAIDSLGNAGEKLKLVQTISEDLIEAINSSITLKDCEEQAKKVENEMEVKSEEFNKFCVEYDKYIMSAEEELSRKEEQFVQRNTNSDWHNFRPNAALKPQILEKDSTAIEVQSFVELFHAFVLDGFQGHPKKALIHIYLQNCCDPLIWASLVKRGIKGLDLDETIKIIQAEGDSRNPIHQRRMQVLALKKTGSHSEYLHKLETHGALMDYDSMSRDSLLMHLFLEAADDTMAKMTADLLGKQPPGDIQDLRAEIVRVENSTWYHSSSNRQRANRAQGASKYWCADCRSETHDTSRCWGTCTICKRRGHKAEHCRSDEAQAKKAEEDKEVARRARKTEKRKERKQKKIKEAKKAAAIEPEKSKHPEQESSSSGEESPRRSMNSRQDRVGTGAARRALAFIDEVQGDVSFGKSCSAFLAGNLSDQPVIQGIIFSSRTSTDGSQEKMIADTGCSIPIVSRGLCMRKKLKIVPTTSLKIIDAGGKTLPICGYATIYAELPQIQKRRRMRAAVLDAEDTHEILVSLEYLKRWDLVTSDFPHQTITSYFHSINNHKTTKPPSYSKHYSRMVKEIYEKEGTYNTVRSPPKECKILKDKLVKKYGDCFKTKLGKMDRMNIPPVKLTLKDNHNVRPEYHSTYLIT